MVGQYRSIGPYHWRDYFSLSRNQKNIMRQWSLEEDFWLRRIAIDHQLMCKDLTDTDLLAEVICNNFGQTEFLLIRLSVGFAQLLKGKS